MAEKQGKIRNLLVRPSKSADLAFNMAGVIDIHNEGVARLGKQLAAYPLARLYDKLIAEVRTHAAQITYDSQKIREELERPDLTKPDLHPHLLFSVRSESLRTSLDQAILRRDNAFQDRYKHRAKIASYFKDVYFGDEASADWTVAPDNIKADPSDIASELPSSKVGRLLTIQRACSDRFAKLQASYTDAENGNSGVAKDSITKTNADSRKITTNKGIATTDRGMATTNKGMATAKTTVKTAIGTRTLAYNTTVDQADTPAIPDQTIAHAESNTIPTTVKADGTSEVLKADATTAQVATSFAADTTTFAADTTTFAADKTTSIGDQISTLHLRTYSFPRRENDDSFLRKQVALQDELIDEKITTLGVSHTEKIMENELEIMDWEIHKLQLNYAHTFLVAPFAGVVTAVYKDLGESVVAGEPVLRIENNERLLLVGRAQFRGILRLDNVDKPGGSVRVVIKDIFEDGKDRELKDVKIVSVRGHDIDNDEYDLILECENPVIDPADASKGRLLPINYHFDRDTTEIYFTT